MSDYTYEELEEQVAGLDGELRTALIDKDQWHDSAKVAEAQLRAQRPVMDAAVKLTQHWVEWDGTENMVPWIQAVANAVIDAVEKSRGEK